MAPNMHDFWVVLFTILTHTHTHKKRKKCTKIQYNYENWLLRITLVSNLPLFWTEFVSFALGVQVFQNL